MKIAYSTKHAAGDGGNTCKMSQAKEQVIYKSEGACGTPIAVRQGSVGVVLLVNLQKWHMHNFNDNYRPLPSGTVLTLTQE